MALLTAPALTTICLGLAGRKRIPRDRHQRPDCGCAKSIDLGRYGACRMVAHIAMRPADDRRAQWTET